MVRALFEKPTVILQARMSSTRFPGKVLKEINGLPMIGWQIRRINQAKTLGHLVVATSMESSDDSLCEFLGSLGVHFYRGDLFNVAQRYEGALRKFNSSFFLRLTADCPLVMPSLIDEMVTLFSDRKVDYLSNTIKPTFPDGLDVEIVSSEAFRRLLTTEMTNVEKEHVTYGIYTRQNQFKTENFANGVDNSHLRWTVDYREDFKFISEIYSVFKGFELEFTYEDVLNLLAKDFNLVNPIPGSRRNESLQQLKSQEEK